MSHESPFSVTFKAGEGYSDPMLTVRGDNAGELEDRLEDVTGDLIQKAVDVAALFRASHVAVLTEGQPAPATQSQATQSEQGATVTQHPSTDKFCDHGKRTFKSGTNSRGDWKGWMCPRPKNASDKCEPIWG